MKVLKINSSAQKSNSISRKMVDNITSQLEQKYGSVDVSDRDVAYSHLPYLNEEFVEAMFNKGVLDSDQEEVLHISDSLIEEVSDSDVLIIGAPIYNFSVPASLKAYFDLIARPGKTFKYSNTGALTGLLENKTAFVVITSGGTKIGSKHDYTKGYITSFLEFIGITNIHFIELDQAGFVFNEKLKIATEKMETILKAS